MTAIGIVSPLGIGARENTLSLQGGCDGVSRVNAFDTSRCRATSAGQVGELERTRVASRTWEKLHRASRMMIVAADEMMRGDPGFVPEHGVIGTTSGGMSFGEAYHRTQMLGQRRKEQATWLANYPPMKPIVDTLDAIGCRAPVQIIANACASGTNAVGHAFHLVRHGLHERVLCGGYDALSEMVFAGFDALQASTAERVRPFDAGRSGLVLGEGAALLALESWESAQRRGSPILAEVLGYGISTDNHHLTQPHPSGIGPELAMRRALEDARLNASEIHYINAHGTATIFNDASEGVAIERIFGNHIPVSSTKGMMGHSLGAAGAIEAVFCILAMQGRFLPPNLHYQAPDPAFTLDIVANKSRPQHAPRMLSNSFGFGGTNASIILGEVAP